MMTTNKAREQANFYATILERTGVSFLKTGAAARRLHASCDDAPARLRYDWAYDRGDETLEGESLWKDSGQVKRIVLPAGHVGPPKFQMDMRGLMYYGPVE